jgi:hypothetical protein
MVESLVRRELFACRAPPAFGSHPAGLVRYSGNIRRNQRDRRPGFFPIQTLAGRETLLCGRLLFCEPLADM